MVLGWLFALEKSALVSAYRWAFGTSPASVKLLSGMAFWPQFAILIVSRDFLEWIAHNSLHRVPVLWRFHRMHHSIRTMDWIGNFRFHWGEVLVYTALKYIPILMLGGSVRAWLVVNVVTLAIGHLNHSNLNISWGPLRYVFNSARMHIWHHDKVLHGTAGVNFGVVFSAWDWIFRTAYMPDDPIQPETLGFQGDERLPDNILWRFFVPFLDAKPREVPES